MVDKMKELADYFGWEWPKPKEVWTEAKGFPDYECSVHMGMRFKKSGREISAFWWNDAWHFALRSPSGRFCFVQLHEVWDGSW